MPGCVSNADNVCVYVFEHVCNTLMRMCAPPPYTDSVCADTKSCICVSVYINTITSVSVCICASRNYGECTLSFYASMLNGDGVGCRLLFEKHSDKRPHAEVQNVTSTGVSLDNAHTQIGAPPHNSQPAAAVQWRPPHIHIRNNECVYLTHTRGHTHAGRRHSISHFRSHRSDIDSYVNK